LYWYRKSFVFVSIFVLVSFFIVSQGNSKIGKEYDDFDETTMHYSLFVEEGPWQFVVMKCTTKGAGLRFYLTGRNYCFFSDQALDIKIDGKITRIPCSLAKTNSALFWLNERARTKIKNAGHIIYEFTWTTYRTSLGMFQNVY
jgi:hypothetical protein